uniref:Uncharacterized protein n=1 Tax=Romanomermis culicivorax TaxID=13658 RepID=A0A915L9S4_ROMCU
MWARVWKNEKERIEFVKWMGQDMVNNKVTEQMEDFLGWYPKTCNQKSVRNLFCALLIKWIPRSLANPLDEQQTNLHDNAIYFMNCNFYNIFHFQNIYAASQNLIYWNVSASIFEAKDLWVPTASRTFKSVCKWDESDLIPQLEVAIPASHGPLEITSKEQTVDEFNKANILPVS